MQFFLPPPHHITSHRHTNLWAKTHAAVKYLLMQCTTRHMTTLGISSGKFYEKISTFNFTMRHYCTALAYHAVSLLQRSYWETQVHLLQLQSHKPYHKHIYIAVKSRLFFFVTEIYKIHEQSTDLTGEIRKKCVCTINININGSPDLFTLYFFVLTRFLKSLLVYTHICMKSWIKNWIGIVTTT